MTKKAGHNEPDNIRDFDGVPGSPYYQEAAITCLVCHIGYEPGYGEESETYPGLNFCSQECISDHDYQQLTFSPYLKFPT